MKQARRYFIAGVVQGVGFRYFARRIARRLGVAGYAKNLMDGRVEVYAIGSPLALQEMEAELRRGPGAAVVSEVITEDAMVEAGIVEGFSIEYDF
jgi:acylphosphatase